MNNFEVLISSPFDRKFLVAEIWYNDKYIAEVNQENGSLNLDIYIEEGDCISLPLEDFLDAVELAKKKLIE